MTNSISVRWKILVDLPATTTPGLSRLFNRSSGRSFIRSLGGRPNFDFTPVTLTCTQHFYDCLRDDLARLGFFGNKFPLRHIDAGQVVNITFRLYGSRLLVMDVATSAQLLPVNADILNIATIWQHEGIGKLTLLIIGSILKADTKGPVQPFPQQPKTYPCMRIEGPREFALGKAALAELLTRHRSASPLLVDEVWKKNSLLQSDASTLLVDRQGIVAEIPDDMASDLTVVRRFAAASNMLEIIACVGRLFEKDHWGDLEEQSRRGLAEYFQSPENRFLHSTSSKLIWLALAAEFKLGPHAFSSKAIMLDTQIRSESSSHSKNAKSEIVLSIHGIRTRGEWQKTLTADLNRVGLRHEPLDYGFFSLIKLLLPFTRTRQVTWFREEYTRIVAAARDDRAHISVVAHSFGTYVVALAIEKYPEIKLNKLVFCGSIVRVDFPWSELLSRNQVRGVLNDCGRRDIWVRLAEWIVVDAGPSGATGFSDLGGGAVIQRKRPHFKHGDHFYSLNYLNSWIPFLTGGVPLDVFDLPRKRSNRKATITVLCILLMAASLVYFHYDK